MPEADDSRNAAMCRSVLQHVAACCSMLQCVAYNTAMCRNVCKCVAVCCSVLQCVAYETAMCLSMCKCVAAFCSVLRFSIIHICINGRTERRACLQQGRSILQCVVVFCSVFQFLLQCVAVCVAGCNVVYSFAVLCSDLQCAAVCWCVCVCMRVTVNCSKLQ